MTGSSLAAELDIRSFGAKCNGNDDSGAVQNALNALNSGDTLNVPCQASIGASGLRLNNKSGVTVRGINGGGFKALALTPIRFVLHITSCVSCKVGNLVIDGANKGVGGLFFQGTEKTTAENNQISNVTVPAAAALVGLGNKNNRYIGNVVLNTGATYSSTGQMQDSSRGLWLGNPGTTTYEWYPYIANNTLRNISGTAIVFHGTSAHIIGNVAEQLSWSGAKVVGAASATGTTIVENNVFSGRGGSGYTGGGVALSGEGGTRENVIIRNNTMQADQEAGVYVTDGPHAGAITITGNTIRGTYQSGITLVATSSNTTIANNRIEQGPLRTIHGIRVLANSGLSIRNVTIRDNTIQSQSQHAVFLINKNGVIDGVDIRNNALTNTGGRGVHIEELTPGIYNVGLTANCFAANAQGTLFDNRGNRALPPPVSSSVCDSSSTGPSTTPDTTAPTVSLTSPAAGHIVNGVTVAANAADNRGVAGLQFLLNGQALGSERTAAPYSVSWDSRTVANGSYHLSAIARDAAGNRTTSAVVTINVANVTVAPTPTPTPPPTPTPTPVGNWLTGWGSRKSVTIPAAQVSGTQVDFPVLVSLASDAQLASRTQSDGRDIVFTAADGTTRLAHSVESFDRASGRLAAWVKLPRISSSANTTLYMYYDNSSAGQEQKPQDVWSNGYTGVWHMSDQSALHPVDETVNKNNAVTSKTATTAPVGGKIMGAEQFSRSGANFVEIPGTASLKQQTLTVEAWVNANRVGNVPQDVISFGDDVTLRVEWNGLPSFYIYDGAYKWFSAPVEVRGGFHHLVGVYDAGTQRLTTYVDGVPRGSAAASKVAYIHGKNVLIGMNGYPRPEYHFDGVIDEVRVSRVSRSAEWIKTQFNNQNAPASFLQIGSVESR